MTFGRLRRVATVVTGVMMVAAMQSCCPPATQRVYETNSSVSQAASRESHGDVLRGDASYYASFFKGRPTASGERYDPHKMTAANRTLPLGTRLRVTRLDTGKSVVVRVNDRGPFGKRRRILDLSRAAAEQLDMIGVGHTEVEAVVLK